MEHFMATKIICDKYNRGMSPNGEHKMAYTEK